MSGERVQKLISRAGVASRRQAEELIRRGVVTVNAANFVIKATRIRLTAIRTMLPMSTLPPSWQLRSWI